MLLCRGSSTVKYNVPSKSQYLLCPICNECFPEISSVILKNKTAFANITCCNSNEEKITKEFSISSLLEKQLPPYTPGTCCMQSFHPQSLQETSSTKYCIICNEWFCNECINEHDRLVNVERCEKTDMSSTIGVNHLFLDRKIQMKIQCHGKNLKRHAEKVINNEGQCIKTLQKHFCTKKLLYYCDTCKIDESCYENNEHNWIETNKAVVDYLPLKNPIQVKQRETDFLKCLSDIVDLFIKSNKNPPPGKKEEINKQINILQKEYNYNKQIHELYFKLYVAVTNNFQLMLYTNVYNHSIMKSLNQIEPDFNKGLEKMNHLRVYINNWDKKYQSNSKDRVENNLFYDIQRKLISSFYYSLSELSASFYFDVQLRNVNHLLLRNSTLITVGSKIKALESPYLETVTLSIETKGQIKGMCKLKNESIVFWDDKQGIIHYENEKSTRIEHKRPIYIITEWIDIETIELFVMIIDDINLSLLNISKLKEKTKDLFKLKHNYVNTFPILTGIQIDDTFFAYAETNTISLVSIKTKDIVEINCPVEVSEDKKGRKRTSINSQRHPSIISCLVKINGIDLHAYGSYNCKVGIWNYSIDDNKFCVNIGEHKTGVVSMISRKNNELISLSADGCCDVRKIRIVDKTLQWAHMLTFQTQMQGGVEIITLKKEGNISYTSDNVVICAKDKIEIWCINTGGDRYDFQNRQVKILELKNEEKTE